MSPGRCGSLDNRIENKQISKTNRRSRPVFGARFDPPRPFPARTEMVHRLRKNGRSNRCDGSGRKPQPRFSTPLRRCRWPAVYGGAGVATKDPDPGFPRRNHRPQSSRITRRSGLSVWRTEPAQDVQKKKKRNNNKKLRLDWTGARRLPSPACRRNGEPLVRSVRCGRSAAARHQDGHRCHRFHRRTDERGAQAGGVCHTGTRKKTGALQA